MIARQIDYIVINNKYRNAVRKAWEEQGRRGNIEQQRQHDVVRMDATMNLMQGYHKKHITESGTDIRYDIKELRSAPGKLQQWLEERRNHTGPINTH